MYKIDAKEAPTNTSYKRGEDGTVEFLGSGA